MNVLHNFQPLRFQSVCIQLFNLSILYISSIQMLFCGIINSIHYNQSSYIPLLIQPQKSNFHRNRLSLYHSYSSFAILKTVEICRSTKINVHHYYSKSFATQKIQTLPSFILNIIKNIDSKLRDSDANHQPVVTNLRTILTFGFWQDVTVYFLHQKG